jgi:hypothetical protein
MSKRALIALGLLVGFVPTASMATQYGLQTMRNWKAGDKCAAQAQKMFPDYTPESNAKRDAQMRACLAGSMLPPRDLSPQPPAAK